MTDREALERIKALIKDGDEYCEIVWAIETVLSELFGTPPPWTPRAAV